MELARCSPSREPVGSMELAAATASATSSMPSPREASSSGSSCTRTAYFFWP